MNSETIVAFSHLPWKKTAHRTQTILTCLAARRRVLFIEEPVCDFESPPHWQFQSPAPHIMVCQPYMPCDWPSYAPKQVAVWRQLMKRLGSTRTIHEPIVWLSTPLAVTLLDELDPAMVVYDCIDAIDAPRQQTPLWNECETKLLSRADMVFTSGFSLYRTMRERHPNVHCFPSSLDLAHFRPTREAQRLGERRTPRLIQSEPEVQARLPHPRLGFQGVLDKRVDFELLDLVARTHPEWQLVLIGPLVDLKPCQLPNRPNLHYLGPRPYEDLPRYISGWDVALVPFIANETTRHLNPVTVLEYMAAERMIVSTRIPDVVEPYCDIVYVSHSPNTFIVGCEKALRVSSIERADRLRLMREVLSHTSWHATVRAIENAVMSMLEQRRSTSLFSLPARQHSRTRNEWLRSLEMAAY